jgi:hypothetical protein
MHGLFCTLLFTSTILLWLAALATSGDFRFVLALIVLLVGVELITLLLRRVGLKLLRIIKVLVIVSVIVLLASNESMREFVQRLVGDTFPTIRERWYVWALLSTIAYGVVCLSQPAHASNPN